ncbi:hypothetical protein [Oceanobacillus jeddahense]|uniref:DUF3221 domain-containing protein n=1 Tax=Oceanobacillus jeddahense TaxID=1462527 RepID=A0ABY5JM85_9BACI|nr:hypothetical protein [Oceanobacillus jeddahense]UUI01408.1 hypothetical protein NP439_15260 [Oceanobacillus jeddahense]
MKEKLLILVMLFVLSACSNSDSNSNNDVVEADLEKMDYDVTEPSELDESEIIQPGSGVTFEGEITNKTEEASGILANRISEQEGVKFESVVFEDSNVFMVMIEETAFEYTILVNDTDDFSQRNEGDFITVTGTFEGMNHQTYGPVIKADEIDGID